MPRTRSEWLHWFRVDCDLITHPRLQELADRLKLDDERCLGRLIRFMGWVARHAPRGVLPSGWEVGGRRSFGQGFPDAMRGVGFIEESPEGDKLHHWWELNGYMIRERHRKRAEVPRMNCGESQPPRALAATASTTTTESEPTHRSRPLAGYSDTFEAWFRNYPRRAAKANAFRAYLKALARTDEKSLIEGVNRYKASLNGTPPDKIKHPATWLNGDCWLDELATGAPAEESMVARIRRKLEVE